MKKLSACNQPRGNIVEVKTSATTSHIRIDIDNGVIVIITPRYYQ